MPLNYIDVAVFLLLLVFGIRGALRGFFTEVAGFIGIVGGLYLARMFSPMAADMLTSLVSVKAAQIIAFVGIVILTMLVVSLIARVLSSLMDFAFVGWLDHLAGAAVGALKGVLLAAVLVYAVIWFFPKADFVAESVTVPPLTDFVQWIIGAIQDVNTAV